MRRYVVVPDSFKGTMDSALVCRTMKEGILTADPGAQVTTIPVADGGEGTVEAFLQAVGGRKINVPVQGPYGECCDGFYGLLPDGTAVVEMAAAAGLPMVGERKNPEATSTYGVGQLLAHALDAGVHQIILGLGGSATNDGGCGMAAALGVRFLDAAGCVFVPVGGTLKNIAGIDMSGAHPGLETAGVRIMCDIDNPLCGPSGAAAVFAPQKGADEAMVQRLDAGLQHLAEVIRRDLQMDIAMLPGAGAAGGMGGGAVAFLGGRLQMGIETVLDVVDFDRVIVGGAAVLTGEGRFDGQSLRGKVVMGVARRAKAQQVPVLVFAGALAEDAEPAYDLGVTAAFSINYAPLPYEEAIRFSVPNLRKTVSNAVRCFLAGRR